MVRRRRIEGDKEVDLAALVDIFSNMLFFLIATVSFLQLKTLNAAVPTLSASAVSTGKSIDITVEIRADGYHLNATGEPADKSVKFTPVNKTIGRKDGRLDSRELTRDLWEIKKLAPDVKNIIISPEPAIVFDEIIQTMDATREMPSILDPKKKVPLFTRPIVTPLANHDPEPAPNAAMPDDPRGVP